MTHHPRTNSIPSCVPTLDVIAAGAETRAPNPTASAAPHPALSRFLSKVSEPDDRGCRLWRGSPTRGKGYGSFSLNGRDHAAHRVSWEFFMGPIPDGMLVLHKCDVRLCVNPEHLFLGTNQDNIDDMVRKGRNQPSVLALLDRKGERSSKARLSEAQAEEILIKFSEGGNISALAKEYGVARQTVGSLVHGRSWTHLVRHSSKSVVAPFISTPIGGGA